MLFGHLSVCVALPVCLSVLLYLSVCLCCSVCLSVCLCWSTRLSVLLCLSVCVSVLTLLSPSLSSLLSLSLSCYGLLLTTQCSCAELAYQVLLWLSVRHRDATAAGVKEGVWSGDSLVKDDCGSPFSDSGQVWVSVCLYVSHLNSSTSSKSFSPSSL